MKHSLGWQLPSIYGLVYTPLSVVKGRNIIIKKNILKYFLASI